MTLARAAHHAIVFALMSTAVPAMAIDYQAAVDGLLAFSASRYSSDVTGNDSNAHTNASNAGLSLSATQAEYRAFLLYHARFERANESVPNVMPGKRETEFFGGVSTPFGTLGYGRQASFYRKAGRELDPFYNTSVVGFGGVFAAEGASYGLSNLTNGFNDDTLAYASPNFGGISLRASWLRDTGDTHADDDYGLGLRYAPESTPLVAGIEFLDSNGGDAVFGVGKREAFNAIRVYGSYRWEALLLGASLEHVDVDNEADKRKYALLTASYALAPKLTLSTNLGLLDDVIPNATANPDGLDGEGLTVGAFYEVTPRFIAYVAARGVRLDSNADTETYAIGARYEFSYTVFP